MNPAGDHRPPTSSPPPRVGRRRSTPIAAAAAAAVAVGLGCSVEKHYDLLSFFFDGVPQPQAEEARAGGPGASGLIAPGARSAHTAFLERRCSDCHGETSRFGFRAEGFTGLSGRTCLRCHADQVEKQRYLHGPVAATACLWCHEPHESPHLRLLVKTGREMCLDCHTVRSLSPSPAHADPSRDCTECHHAHGGDDRAFLRPEYGAWEQSDEPERTEPAAPPIPDGEEAPPRDGP